MTIAEELENKKKTAESEKTSLANQLSNLVNEMEKTKKKTAAKIDDLYKKEPATQTQAQEPLTPKILPFGHFLDKRSKVQK